MQLENLASAILIFLILGLAFFAGYGWRTVVERRLHNMPWLRKSARKASEAAARSNLRPIILPTVALAEPLERQDLVTKEVSEPIAGTTPAPTATPETRELSEAQPASVPTVAPETTTTSRRYSRLSLRRQLETK